MRNGKGYSIAWEIAAFTPLMRVHPLRACEEMPSQYARSLNDPRTLRRSREGGNPVRRLRGGVCVLDSRLRGNDVILVFFHKL